MLDLLLLDEQLHDDERLVRDTVKRFVVEAVEPQVMDAYEKGLFPNHWIKQVAELGLLGLTLPTRYGGSGAGYVTYGLVCQELEYGDSGLRSFVSVQNSLCMYPIFAFGSEEQRERFLPAMARGELIGCFGLTEPDAGSDPSRISTHATRVNGGWQLTGSKLWITNAAIADLAIVWANTEAGIRGFIVDCQSEGVTANTIHHKMSLRASNTGELVFENCFVPDSHYLPGSNKGLSAALSCLNQARYGIAWGAMGAAMACYDAALRYTKEREQFGKPIASFQLVQAELVAMLTEICKAQCLNLQVGRLKEKDQAHFSMISLIKRNACREALTIARNARHLLGANGISLEYPVIRPMMNLESVFTYEGTDTIHTLILGKHITGINGFN